MKLKNTITIILHFLVFITFGQTKEKIQIEQGITYSPTFTFNDDSRNSSPAFNFSVGAFTKYTIQKKLSVWIGIEYQKQTIINKQWERCGTMNQSLCEISTQDKFQIAKIPIWLSINLNHKTNPNPKLKIDLIGGYAFGKLLYRPIKEEEYDLPGLVDNVFFGFVGIEFQKKITDNLKLTLGSHLEGTNIYDKTYGDIQNLKIILRVSK